MRFFRLLIFGSVVLVMTGCAVGPDYKRPEAALPVQWYAPLPHGGKVAGLVDWWGQFDDPVLVELIRRAEASSPTLAEAAARIVESRTDVAVAENTLWPTLESSASKTRGNERNTLAPKLTKANVEASWEIDLFGGGGRALEAAAARREGAQAHWHDARVSLAAEIGQRYVGLRSCEALLADLDADTASLATSDLLTQEKVKVGFGASADGALVSASLAEAKTRAIAQAAECAINIKALVALTGIDEPTLRKHLRSNTGKVPVPAELAIDELPIRLLSHRPDLLAAEWELVAANAEIGKAKAALFPRFSLLGNVGVQRLSYFGTSYNGNVWSFGPSLDLPIFDAGKRLANVEAAKARYESALASYKAKVRQAVREVEEALVQLDSANRREFQSRLALERYTAAFQAALTRRHSGFSSQLELEEFRRRQIDSRKQHVIVCQEAVVAWIALYRAVGGGWEAKEEK